MVRLLGDSELERSAVVANCRMNRERSLLGSNGYAREVGFDPLDRAVPGQPFRWLDLCCGTGTALVEAARLICDRPEPVEIIGVDLVGLFHPIDPDLRNLGLVAASVSTWTPAPGQCFDLITCVHGLHYVGDKLGLIARAAGWLTAGGLFVASLDLGNLQIDGVAAPTRHLRASFRRADLEYDPRRRLIRTQGRRTLNLPYHYLGANDAAGPNFTGQPAVDSCYEVMIEPDATAHDQR